MFYRIKSFFKRRSLNPDLDAFNRALHRSVNVEHHDNEQVAKDFRRLFLSDPELGKRVLFMLMTWCEEYNGVIPEDESSLNRWAGKQEVAWKIKAALHGNIDEPPQL